MQQVSKQVQTQSAEKKAYTTPSLSRIGNVEQLTQVGLRSGPITGPQ